MASVTAHFSEPFNGNYYYERQYKDLANFYSNINFKKCFKRLSILGKWEHLSMVLHCDLPPRVSKILIKK